jgi:hypothetical protein
MAARSVFISDNQLHEKTGPAYLVLARWLLMIVACLPACLGVEQL